MRYPQQQEAMMTPEKLEWIKRIQRKRSNWLFVTQR